MRLLTLRLLPSLYTVCRLPADAPTPAVPREAELFALVRTRDELSVVTTEADAPVEAEREDGWRALAVRGPLDFALVGILAELSARLAAAGVSLFALSTYETDLLLVPGDRLEDAVTALRRAGHRVEIP